LLPANPPRDLVAFAEVVHGIFLRCSSDMERLLHLCRETASRPQQRALPEPSGRSARPSERGRGSRKAEWGGERHPADRAAQEEESLFGAEDREERDAAGVGAGTGNANAKKAIAIYERMESAILGSRVLTLFAAWCDTAMPRMRAVAYQNIAFRYDPSLDVPLQRLSLDARRDVYISIPHNLINRALSGDPLLSVLMDEVAALNVRRPRLTSL